MERYSSYKDSGISWTAEIPSHWDFLAGKKLFLKNDGGVWGTDPLNDGKDTIVLRSTEQTVDGKLVIENPAKRCLSEKEKQGSLLEENDLIITKSSGSPAHIGKTSIITKEIAQLKCSYSNFIQRIRIKGCPMYYWFVFNSTLIKTQFDILTTTTTGLKNISAKIIDRVMLPLPPLAEQEKIVSYLESKTSKIDAYVADKENEIQLLQELKQKTIAEAVTKGLNPIVKMKNSGISWLGMIPEQWETKRIASLFTGKVKANTDFEYHHAFKFYYGTLVPKNEVGDIEEYRETYVKYSVLKKDDIMINGLNLNYDFVSQRVAIAPSDGIITSAYVVARPRKNTNAQYYSYLFKTMDNMKLFHGMGTGIRLTLSFDEMKKQVVVVPPKDEQQAIVAYIEEKCQKIDTLIMELQAEIDYLKEYKQRLIADVVTGQVNVQNEMI